MRLTIAEEDFEFGTGDSVYFAADVSHEHANATSFPCTYYVAALIMRRPGHPAEQYQYVHAQRRQLG